MLTPEFSRIRLTIAMMRMMGKLPLYAGSPRALGEGANR